ncbi:MAG: PAS domain S-box protein [bacterium]
MGDDRLRSGIEKALCKDEDGEEPRRLNRLDEDALRESEEKFRLLFESALVGVMLHEIVADQDGTPRDYIFQEGNAAFETLTGFRVRDLMDKSVKDRAGGVIRATPLLAVFDRVAMSGEPVLFEQFIAPLGRHYLVNVSRSGGRWIATVFLDITERRRAEEALKASEARFSTVFHASPAGCTISRMADGRIIDANPAVLAIMGYTHEEAVGRTTHELGMWVCPPERERLVRTLAEQGRVRDTELRLRRKSGEIVDVLLSAEPIELAGEQVMLSLLQDITDRKRVEQTLRESEERYRHIVETANEGIWSMDAEHRTTFVNLAMARMLGYEAGEMAGVPLEDFLFPDELEDHQRRMEVRHQGKDGRYERRFRRKDGGACWCLVSATALRDDQGRFAGSFAMLTDITARVVAETRLREREEQFRQLFDNMSSGVAVYRAVDDGADFVLRDVNRAVERIEKVARDDLLGRRVTEVFPGVTDFGLLAVLQRVQRTGKAERLPATVYRDARIVGWRENYVFRLPSGEVVAVYDDITEQKELEAQLRQAQKMEAVGQLAGGVAHDFNNLLTVITGFSDMLLARVPENDPGREFLGNIREAGERAAALTRQLLAFSRKQILEPKVLDLNETVRNIEKMLRRLIGEDIVLTTALSPTLSRVKVDPSQMEQVVMNLAVNARDAMPRGGRLAIETRNVELNGDYCRLHPESKPGPYARLCVTDTGCGMTPEVKARIFEPFFTTKGAGKGTGLGLAAVFGIVKQSGGQIEIDSQVGVGTSFRIYLPAVEEAEASPRPDRVVEPAQPGRETILLVEDEEQVRQIARLALETQGYKVLEADGGPKAVSIAEAFDGPIQLLVTDVVMPEMNGRELAELLLVRRPALKVLFMSGYTMVRLGMAGAPTAFLHKPFSPLALAKKVRDLLDGGCRWAEVCGVIPA